MPELSPPFLSFSLLSFSFSNSVSASSLSLCLEVSLSTEISRKEASGKIRLTCGPHFQRHGA